MLRTDADPDDRAQICIRSRAVIITEIYCKALRRRDLSGAVAARPVSATKDESGSDDASKPKTETVEANITNLVGVDAFFICKHDAQSFLLDPKLTTRCALQPRLRGTCTISSLAFYASSSPCACSTAF